MTGLLHALVEDAAREAGCSVGRVLAHGGSRAVSRARHKAMYRAAEHGFSREQTARVFNRTKRAVVMAVAKIRDQYSPHSPLFTGETGNGDAL